MALSNGIEAVKYAHLGWKIFRVAPDSKTPPKGTQGVLEATSDIETIKKWWFDDPHLNIGCAAGPSNIVVIDIDPRHNGWDTILDLGIEGGTITSLTPNGGEHWIYRTPDANIVGGANKLGPGVDIRAGNLYIVLPPSKLGEKVYAWENGYSPFDIPPSPLPQAIIDKLKPEDGDSLPKQFSGSGQLIPNGCHDSWLFARARSYRGAGDTEDMILEKLKVDLRRLDGVDPRKPYTLKDLKRIAHSACNYSANPPNNGRNKSNQHETKGGIPLSCLPDQLLKP